LERQGRQREWRRLRIIETFDMQKVLIIAASVIIACSHARSQGITLGAGDTYTYTFNTLALQGPDFEPPAPGGRVDASFDPVTFGPGDALLCEMFENSPDEVAIASQTAVYLELVPKPEIFQCKLEMVIARASL
jgi:hypothetical protein